jgi:clathrin heavy chain
LQDREIAEDLLRFFVEPQFKVASPHCFAACLYTCYGLIRPDVALELAWKHKLIDFSFPFLIQLLKGAQ